MSRSTLAWCVRAAAAIAIAALAADGYSWGEFGVPIGSLGPSMAPNTIWQIIIASIVAIALAATAALVRRSPRVALRSALIGTLAYAGMNTVLFLRDGSGRLVTGGYVATAPGRALVLGALAHLWVILLMWRLTRLARGEITKVR